MRVILFILLIILTLPSAMAGERYLVFAASSMKDAIEEIAVEYEKNSGNKLVLSLAGTAKLARQIDHGAPADIFISADRQWMEWLIERKHVTNDNRVTVAGNRLVIAVRREIENWADPLAMLTKGLAAIADPQSIPAGRYAKQVLSKMGIWEEVSKNAVRTENVRLALALVARGEVEAAIVYQSDVAAEPKVRTAFHFSRQSNRNIAYPAAVLKDAKPGSRKVLAYLTSKTAQDIFKKHGFQPAGQQD